MKELTNRKTNRTYLLDDDHFRKLIELDLLKKFTWKEIEPIKRIIPTPAILKITEKVEVKKQNKKNDERGTKTIK